MPKDDKERKEVLNQLTIKLAATAHQLGEAARRLQLAELTYREYLGRLRKLDEHMRSLIRLLQGTNGNAPAPAPETNPAFCNPPPKRPTTRKLRYADYIEFSNYAELKKFEKMQKISDEEIKKCNADELMKKLMNGDGAK